MSDTIKIFFDTEFTGLTQHTKLLSLGAVAEDGSAIYLEIENNLKYAQDNEWLMKNVVSHMMAYGNKDISKYIENSHDLTLTSVVEDEPHLKNTLDKWLISMVEPRKLISGLVKFQFISDVSHYDFVLFCELYGGALNLPEYIVPSCHDINQDIARYYTNGDEMSAFNMNRESLCARTGIKMDRLPKHNALHDAYVIKALYDYMYQK